MPPPIRHTSGTLCRPPTCAHTNTHTMGHSVPPPAFPSLPVSLFLLPPLPSPPLPSSLGLEHWVPEPGLGSRQPGPPGAIAGHTVCTPHACPPQPSLATAMGTRVSCDCKAAPGGWWEKPQGRGGRRETEAQSKGLGPRSQQEDAETAGPAKRQENNAVTLLPLSNRVTWLAPLMAVVMATGSQSLLLWEPKQN